MTAAISFSSKRESEIPIKQRCKRSENPANNTSVCECVCPCRGIDDYSCLITKPTLSMKFNLDVKLRPDKHEYLSNFVYDIPRSITNRTIDTLMGRPHLPYDLEKPFFKLESAQPQTFAPYVDQTRAKEGYGNWAIHKLRRELKSPDPILVIQAINTLLDKVKDPIWTVEVIKEGLISKILNLMLDPNNYIRERIAMILQTIAAQAAGIEALLSDKRSLIFLKKLILDKVPDVRHKALGAVITISRLWTGIIALIEKGYEKLILGLIKKENLKINLNFELEILYILLDEEEAKNTAIEMNAYRIFLQLVKEKNENCIKMRALGCLGHLCLNKGIQKRAMKGRLLKLLEPLLMSEDEDIQRRTAGVICNLSTITEAIHQLLQMNLYDRLIDLAGNFHYPDLQINCLKILTYLAGHEDGRINLLEEIRLNMIENIFCAHNEIIENYLIILINQIKWEP